MKLYRYWSRVDVDAEGRPTAAPGFTAAAGWSNESVEHAYAVALERAARFAQWWRDRDDRLVDRYAYSDRPMREPIVDEIHHGGHRLAAVTRNAYGAFVLNTAGTLFADIDRPRPSGGAAFRSVWDALRGRKQPSAEEALIEQLRDLADRRGIGLRLYRTRGGHRAIVTSRTFDPLDESTAALLADFGSDPLYMHLCRAQECFRARLSPKPWRIKIAPPAASLRFPRRDETARAAFAAWSAEYEAASRAWAVCEPVATLGDQAVHDQVWPVLNLHDELTTAPGKPLA